MTLEEAERFVAAAERDLEQRIWRYRVLMQEEDGPDEEELREVRADVLAAQQVLDLARSKEWRARQAQEERERAEEERMRREQGPRGHAGWCDHCGAAGAVFRWGDADLCPQCHARQLRAAAGEGEGS